MSREALIAPIEHALTAIERERAAWAPAPSAGAAVSVTDTTDN